ncbi:hypothetical protein [Arthrobacter sp. ov118]|uniref:hypothetical protein n=1 Tax=Arthrobacter sp. ov118 TaxID=1761747 RepID=UPI0008F33BD9|nr:hypothetical protein [Arthrobacter sp. ov118]SFT66329.1 Glycosyl hydrolase family 79, N-terminal domain [Arthrobacter sp. ov118]
MARFDSSPGKADSPDPRNTANAGTNAGKQRKRSRIVAGAGTAVVIAAAVVLIPLSLGSPTPAPPAPPASSGSAPASTPALTPAEVGPRVTYYAQPGPPAGSPLEKVEPLKVDVSSDLVGTALNKGTMGISLEATDLADPDLSSDNASMVKLLKELDQPVLRFGGNAVDRRFFWTSTGEAVPADYKGDKTHPVKAVGPADLTRLKTLLEAGDAKVTLTVDLGHYNPARAADMVKNASQILGDRLLSITVGNEPNGFVFNDVKTDGYSVDQYVRELKDYASAIYAVAPNVPISGPGAFDSKWWQPFVDADIPQKKVLTFHHYPLSDCDGNVPQDSPTMANLVSHTMHDRAIDYQKAALAVGRAAGLETWIPETGVSACPGSNETSRTHASALWAADYALTAAQLGITRVSFHSSLLTCKGGPPLSAICSAGTYPFGNGKMSGRANFYGISMVAELEAGKFLKLGSSGGGLAFNYALQHADGSTSVVIINENDPEKAEQTSVTLNLPGKPVTGTMTQLSGPSYAAEDQTVIDGVKSEPTPLAKRATVPGFAYKSGTQNFKLTAGTVTVLNFKY